MNLLPGDLLPVEGKPAGTATVGARTEHLRIERAGDGSGVGRVQRIEHLGDQNHIHLAVGDHTLVALADPASELRTGDPIDIRLENPVFFDRDGERIATRGDATMSKISVSKLMKRNRSISEEG